MMLPKVHARWTILRVLARLMLDMRGRAVRDVLAVQFHRPVTVFAAKLRRPSPDSIYDAYPQPLPTLHASAHEQFLHFTLVDLFFIRHVTLSTLRREGLNSGFVCLTNETMEL